MYREVGGMEEAPSKLVLVDGDRKVPSQGGKSVTGRRKGQEYWGRSKDFGMARAEA